MFYEIKDKRIDQNSQTRWWVTTAAFCGIIITATFFGIIFWLGTSTNPKHESSLLERRTVSFQEFEFGSAPGPALPKNPELKLESTPTIPPSPNLEYPTAEILKATIKNKKAKIELVDPNNGEVVHTLNSKSGHLSTSGIPRDPQSQSDEIVSITSHSRGPETQTHLPINSNSRRRVPTLNIERYANLHLQEGINPLEESHNFPANNNPELISSSVKKKSEAVPPSWFDPNLQDNNSGKPVDIGNHLKSDSVYDISEFSSIKPDLSSFNMKTIPAFTYLKEPVPEFDNIPSKAPGDPGDSIQAQEDLSSYYYQQEKFSNITEDAENVAENDEEDEEEEKVENTLSNFFQRRIKDLQDWVSRSNQKNRTSEILKIFKAMNQSFHHSRGGAALVLSKLMDFYKNLNSSDFQNMPVANLLYPTGPNILNNSSSLVSFGLLAIDLFLLHNVQQIVWNEENQIGEEMLKDPDVLALNALFLPPEKLEKLKDSSNSRIFTTGEQKGGVLHELIEFVNGSLRAVINLSKAYKSSTNSRARSSKESTPIDCIWTLYCRNLDKTAKLRGPYGFLAKMNSLGLRLMMGEFPVNKALERLMHEYNKGWGTLNCDKLFPRCKADEAKEVVIQTVLGRTSV